MNRGERRYRRERIIRKRWKLRKAEACYGWSDAHMNWDYRDFFVDFFYKQPGRFSKFNGAHGKKGCCCGFDPYERNPKNAGPEIHWWADELLEFPVGNATPKHALKKYCVSCWD